MDREKKPVNPMNNTKELRRENNGKEARGWPLISPFLKNRKFHNCISQLTASSLPGDKKEVNAFSKMEEITTMSPILCCYKIFPNWHGTGSIN